MLSDSVQPSTAARSKRRDHRGGQGRGGETPANGPHVKTRCTRACRHGALVLKKDQPARAPACYIHATDAFPSALARTNDLGRWTRYAIPQHGTAKPCTGLSVKHPAFH